MIAFIGHFKYEKNQLLLEQIKLPEQTRLAATINTLLDEKDFSINEIHNYIDENIKFYNQENESNAVIILCGKFEDALNNKTNIEIKECTDKNLTIEKTIDKDTEILYEITINDYSIKNITISDKQIEEQIIEQIKDIETTSFNIVDVIKGIINYTLPKETNTENIKEEVLIIAERVKKYL
jgi:hypothetical protein